MDTPDNKKPALELKELELKVRELEFKIKDMELPSYKKFSFWTSIISVAIAVIGIAGQSILSNIKDEQAKLNVAIAKKEMSEAEAKTAIARIGVVKASNELLAIQKKKDSIKADLNKMAAAYNEVVSSVAYSNAPDNNSQATQRTTHVASETSNSVSNILLNISSASLLQNSILKIYYTETTKAKAIEMDNLLKSQGVKSEYTLPTYDITKVGHNEIVYYSAPQLNYCKAVQACLKQWQYGNFTIRLSSGANATTNHFKIYLVQ